MTSLNFLGKESNGSIIHRLRGFLCPRRLSPRSNTAPSSVETHTTYSSSLLDVDTNFLPEIKPGETPLGIRSPAYLMGNTSPINANNDNTDRQEFGDCNYVFVCRMVLPSNSPRVSVPQRAPITVPSTWEPPR